MEFFQRLFGTNEGELCIVTINKGNRQAHFFSYPDDLSLLEVEVAEFASERGTNVYFFPMLVDGKSANAEIICEPVIAADLDMVDPVLVDPVPIAIVESSGGRFQAYWKSGDALPSSVNGPIPNDLGLKRVPGTKNWKYKGDTFEVREVDPADLNTYEKTAIRRKLAGDAYNYLFKTNDQWSLARLCARMGCGPTEVFLVLRAAQHYAGERSERHEYVDIARLYKDATEAVRAASVPSFLAPEEMRRERERVNGNGGHASSFVDMYLSWAAECTDAPRQYHVAGAFTVLSSLLAPLVKFPTSFGTFKPNLWFMILGETTLTRKTTSMEMAIRTAKCVEPEIVMATDGSPEGILTALSDRDGKGSVFFKDEVTGLLRAAKDKQYMSDFLEMLTRLYDGNGENRRLRRNTIEVKDPYLVLLCGGIKNTVIDLLDMEHIASGFLLRFLIVTGKTRLEDIRPIGPPQKATTDKLEVMNDYLGELVDYYTAKTLNPLSKNSASTRGVFTATEEAWDRLGKLEADAKEFGMREANTDIFCPLMDRLKNSVIKVALLLAADRAFRARSEPVITLQDIVTAISYSSIWVESMYELTSGIDDKPSKDELRNIRIVATVGMSETGMTRTEVMRKYRLTKHEMDSIEVTLLDREQIILSTVGRKKVYRSPAVGELSEPD
jgi:hypothetical protein